MKTGGDIVVYGSNALEFKLPFVPLILKNVRLRFFIVYHLNAADRRSACDTTSKACSRRKA